MQRLFIAALALVVASGAAAAHAQSQDRQDRARVAYAASDLASVAAYGNLQQRIQAQADAYCRANPVGGTIAACRRDVAQSMVAQVQAQRAATLAARREFAQTSR